MVGQRGRGRSPLISMVVVVTVVAVVIPVVMVATVFGSGVQGHGPAEAHDGLRHVVEEGRQLVPVDGSLPVHVVDVEDKLHFLVPAAPARDRQAAHELLVVDLPGALLVKHGEQPL